MKKYFFLLLGLLLMLSLGACTQSTRELEFFKKDDGTYVVELGDAKYLTKIKIPSRYRGRAVTEVGRFESEALEEISIPKRVEKIKDDAFKNCKNLRKVTIANGVTEIGENAFYGCERLAMITIPKSVIAIGKNAFGGASPVIRVEHKEKPTGFNSGWDGDNTVVWDYPNNQKTDDGALYIENGDFLFVIEKGETAAEVSLTNKDLTEAVVPATVTWSGVIYNVDTLANKAFLGCEKLTSVTLPESIKYIGASAFSDCKKLTEVSLGSAVESIGSAAFLNCESLVKITLPKQVKQIKSEAFSGCASLTEISLDGIESIGANAFKGCGKLTSVIVPASVTYVGSSAFSGCSKLERITLPFVGECADGTGNTAFNFVFGGVVPDALKTVVITGGDKIAFNAFQGCSKLERITLPFVGECADGTGNTHFGYIFGAVTANNNAAAVPASLKSVTLLGGESIATSAFTSCSGLTSISLPEGLLSIHAGAFTFCSSLTSVTIPNTVESIGERAFSFCSALTAVTIPKSVTAIGPRAFAYGSAKLTIYTEHAQKPEGWDAAWSEGARSVVFDAK